MVIKAISDHPEWRGSSGERIKGRGLGTQLWEASRVTGRKKRHLESGPRASSPGSRDKNHGLVVTQKPNTGIVPRKGVAHKTCFLFPVPPSFPPPPRKGWPLGHWEGTHSSKTGGTAPELPHSVAQTAPTKCRRQCGS